MKICPNCGNLNEEDNTLCRVCGELLNIMYFIYKHNLPTQYFYNYE